MTVVTVAWSANALVGKRLTGVKPRDSLVHAPSSDVPRRGFPPEACVRFTDVRLHFHIVYWCTAVRRDTLPCAAPVLIYIDKDNVVSSAIPMPLTGGGIIYLTGIDAWIWGESVSLTSLSTWGLLNFTKQQNKSNIRTFAARKGVQKLCFSATELCLWSEDLLQGVLYAARWTSGCIFLQCVVNDDGGSSFLSNRSLLLQARKRMSSDL